MNGRMSGSRMHTILLLFPDQPVLHFPDYLRQQQSVLPLHTDKPWHSYFLLSVYQEHIAVVRQPVLLWFRPNPEYKEQPETDAFRPDCPVSELRTAQHRPAMDKLPIFPVGNHPVVRCEYRQTRASYVIADASLIVPSASEHVSARF